MYGNGVFMKIALMGGTGYLKELNGLFRKEADILFFIDNHAPLSGNVILNKKVYSPYDFPDNNVDFIIIFIYDSGPVKRQLMDLGVAENRIIEFCAPDLDLSIYKNIFELDAAETLRLKISINHRNRRIRELEECIILMERNYLHEAADKLKKGKVRLPKVCSVEDTCKKLIADRCSISRYGDGEFELIFGNAKDIYQSGNAQLAGRLKEILTSSLPDHIVAIASDYGSLEQYREQTRTSIRRYMTPEKREQHYALLNMDKEYYNAYISRPYVIYPRDQREQAAGRFHALKQIWDQQDVLFVEGDKTRMGVGNDLFCNAKSISRILAPNENAYDVYDEILHAALQYGKNKLILLALGPSATVLAYDLAEAGYRALDIGHLDLEYEWFLKGEGHSYIAHKYNNEMFGDTRVIPVYDQCYEDSVVCTVGISVC